MKGDSVFGDDMLKDGVRGDSVRGNPSIFKILDAYPATALAEPGAEILLHVDVEVEGGAGSREAGLQAELRAELREHAEVVSSAHTRVTLQTGRQTLEIAVPPPARDGRTGAAGYEALLRLQVGGESADEPQGTGTGRTAVLIADHWRHAPRYGFLSEFAPGASHVDRVRELAKFHITVVQFYDWMYRHYAFLPPDDVFEDAMGRELSLATVQARIAACRSAGMAALAYGAVYGAEPEFVHDHPEWVLHDANGKQLSLIDLFYITDLRADAPWREHILREFESAVRDAGFDGIHMDQYGFPKWSYDTQGQAVRLDDCFPSVIDEAADRVAQQREGAAVLFNAVNNWPIDRVAPTDQAAVYIEVWPPHDTYGDLVGLIRRARDLSGKQVILAAYLEPFREGGGGAEYGALLATAVIASAGGHHLLLGEGDAVLRDPYYPNHGRMTPEFAARMRRYYDHTAAHHRDLFDPELRDVTTSFLGGINNEITLTGAKLSAHPIQGRVWGSVKQRGNLLVINLVNMVAAADAAWNEPKPTADVLEGLKLRLSEHFAVERAVWSSPDDPEPAREIPLDRDEKGTVATLPALGTWGTVVVAVRDAMIHT